jgi:hemolysin activation/secretion protein
MPVFKKYNTTFRHTLLAASILVGNILPENAHADTPSFNGLIIAQRDITRPQKAVTPASSLDNPACDNEPIHDSLDQPLPALSDDSAIQAYRSQLKAEGIISLEPTLANLNSEQLKTSIQSLIGQPIDQNTINAVRTKLLDAVNAENTMLADIYFPPQKSQDGYIVAVVAPARVGKINTINQKFYDGDRLACEIRNRPGTRVNLQSITEDMQWLNRTPWRISDSSFSPGENPGEADITLSTQDRMPFRPYFSMDNSGTRYTGLDRFRYGFSWGNAFGQFDHRLDYSYTMSDISNAISGHNFSYSLPVYARTSLSFAFSTSNTQAVISNGDFLSTGQNTIATLSVNHILPASSWLPGLLQEISGGLEYKHIGNNLTYGETLLSNTAPEIGQLFADYSMGLSDSLGKTNAYTHFVVSPGFGFGNNTDQQFQATRAGASNSYWYWRQTVDRIINLPEEWSLRGLMTFQYTTDQLLYSERMGLTGMYAVRGYYSNSLFGDRGLMFNVELNTPTYKPSILGKTGQLQGYIFTDWGRAFNETAEYVSDLGYTSRQHEVASTGFGGRFVVSPYLQFNGSLGFALQGMQQHPEPFLGNFSVVVGL